MRKLWSTIIVMFRIALALSMVGVVVLLCEWLWYKKIISGEYARKIVHIITGTIIAFLPYFMTWRQVQVTGGLGLLGVMVIRFGGFFKSWYDIERVTWGDIIGAAVFWILSLPQG